jgi:hypothetical protein
MVAIPIGQTDPSKGSGDWLTCESDSIFLIDDVRIILDSVKDGMPTPHILVSATIQSSTIADQVGKKVKEDRFPLSGNGLNRTMEFACACGIYSKPQWEADVAAGVNPDLPLENCVGILIASPVRHKKWDDSRDTKYWNGEISDLQARINAGEDADGKLQQKLDRAQDTLANKRGRLQWGGPSGFTYWAVGDAEADGIPMKDEDLALFPGGMLPTKQGTPRKRGSGPQGSGPASRPAKLPPKPPAGGNGHAVKPQQTKPAAAAAGVGSDFF